MLLSVWLFSWTPYSLVFLANISGYSSLVTHHTDMLPGKYIEKVKKLQNRYYTFILAIFAKLSTAVNPLIYGLM